MGSIDSQAQTEKGVAYAAFRSTDNRSGIANIYVHSGNAEVSPESITINIGGSVLHTLSLSADPQNLPAGGGISLIKITAYDENLNTLANIPIILTTDSGQLNSGGAVIYTNAQGEANDTLQTNASAVVTATCGAVSANITIAVQTNEQPIASFVSSPANPAVGQNVYFDASGSFDPDGSIVSYQWSLGDGSTASGVSINHQYLTSGVYTVQLVVTDNNGKTDSTEKSITVANNQNPTASFVYSPTSPITAENVYFNASGSSDPDGTIVKFQWDMGDGATGSGEKITHRYSKSGTYTVLLIVTDNSGNSDSTSQIVTITDNQTPTASFVYSPLAPKSGENVYFNASDSSDPDGTIVKFQWDFGDGGTGNGKSVSHIYTAPGTYTVVLVVVDNSGNQASVGKSITIGI